MSQDAIEGAGAPGAERIDSEEAGTLGLGAPDERRRRIEALKQDLVGGDLFTAAEVAEILDIHPRTVGEYIRDGKIKALQLGGGWKVSESALRVFVGEQTEVAPPPRDETAVRQAIALLSDVANRFAGRSAYKCSFCGKPQEQVQRMIAGPGRVHICNECVALCNEIIEKERGKRP